MRKWFVILWLSFILSGIAGLFWRLQWVYSLPTPVPVNYKPVKLGEPIDVGWKRETKPLFLHFFNPDCPCSRFNIPHFNSLVKLYGDKVDFAIVPMSSRAVTIKEIQDRFDLDIPVLLDTAIARLCGVYSTPQAAIIDVHQILHYRGNYNKSRYCSDKRTEYAKIGLAGLLRSDATMVFDPIALKAYGCRLPLCTTK